MKHVLAAAPALLAATAAHAIDLPSPRSAAVDQPRIILSLAKQSAPDTPLVAQDPFGGDSIAFEAFYDTGASALVLGNGIADTLGLERVRVDGRLAEFADVGGTGVSLFNISEPLTVYAADSLGFADNTRGDRLSNPNLFPGDTYGRRATNLRAQIGPVIEGGGGIFTSDVNVAGVPLMEGRVVTMDLRPTNGFLDYYVKVIEGRPLDDDDLDVFMYTTTHEPGTAFNPGSRINPGIPRTDVHIATSYGDFDRYTTATPGAPRPTTSRNPFIGADPVTGAGDAPGVRLKLGDRTSEGSWLYDTGAAASFVSTRVAGDLGVRYVPGREIGTADPLLEGVPLSRQFQLTIQGISGQPVVIAGFFADEMLIRTLEGDALDPDDPNHLNFAGMPVLVNDIALTDPDTGEELVLDGIMGVNPFTASTDFEILPGEFLPIISDYQDTPFDFMTFDHTTGVIGLDFDAGLFDNDTLGGLEGFTGGRDGFEGGGGDGGGGGGFFRGVAGVPGLPRTAQVPEPAALILLAAGPLALMRRRR